MAEIMGTNGKIEYSDPCGDALDQWEDFKGGYQDFVATYVNEGTALLDAVNAAFDRHELAKRRIETLNALAPRCAWEKFDNQCTFDERRARATYHAIEKQQERYEIEEGV